MSAHTASRLVQIRPGQVTTGCREHHWCYTRQLPFKTTSRHVSGPWPPAPGPPLRHRLDRSVTSQDGTRNPQTRASGRIPQAIALAIAATRMRSCRHAPRVIGPGRQDKQPARAQHDLARGSLDRHATYFVAAHVAGAAGNPGQLAAAPLAVRAARQTAPRPPAPAAAAVTRRYSMANANRLMLRWHLSIPTPGSHAQPRHRVHTVVPGQRYLCLLRLWARRSSCSSHQSAPSGSSGKYRPAQRRTGSWPGPFSGLGGQACRKQTRVPAGVCTGAMARSLARLWVAQMMRAYRCPVPLGPCRGAWHGYRAARAHGAG
jgi:hypothetical protein